MIRTPSTFVVGAGASMELQLPGTTELLNRIGQSYDFRRFGTDLQTRDITLLGQYLQKHAARAGKNDEAIHRAAERIRHASKMGTSIEAIVDQHDTDPLIAAAAKLAIVHFICQAEAKSILRSTPRMEGDLPIQGEDTWLFRLGQLITTGVPRSRAESCLDNLSIICFNYDRSIEHFLPWAMVMAFGMTLTEAQLIVTRKLKIVHPYGTVGRLPWQGGELPDCDWGTEQPWNIQNLSQHIRTPAEVSKDRNMLNALRGMITESKRIIFLGFGFQPQNIDLLIDYSLSHDPEVIGTVYGMPQQSQSSVLRMLKRKTGIDREDLLMLMHIRANDLLRDYALLLES